jgi:pimeloyl-ACP methyl ester carboxylesterase
MPTTTAGTAYTTFTATPVGGDQTRWAVADAVADDANVPLLVYCHGNSGAYNQFSTTPAWQGLREWIVDNGWAWVESDGGGGTSWGGPAARASYEAAATHVRGILDIGPIVVLGRSMGGLVAYWLYTQSSFAADCVGLIISSGTTDLAHRYAVADSGVKAEMRVAYGAANDGAFATNSIGYDPMLFDLSAWDGTNVLQVIGTADTTVPPSDNGLAIRALWSGHPAIDRLDVREGGDHSQTNGTYFQVPAMTTFLAEVSGRGSAIERVTYDVVNAYLMGPGGELYTFAPQPPE